MPSTLPRDLLLGDRACVNRAAARPRSKKYPRITQIDADRRKNIPAAPFLICGPPSPPPESKNRVCFPPLRVLRFLKAPSAPSDGHASAILSGRTSGGSARCHPARTPCGRADVKFARQLAELGAQGLNCYHGQAVNTVPSPFSGQISGWCDGASGQNTLPKLDGRGMPNVPRSKPVTGTALAGESREVSVGGCALVTLRIYSVYPSAS